MDFGDLIEPKLRSILLVLIKKDNELFHLSKLSSESKVPISTVFRIMKTLMKMGIIEQTIVGKTKLFKLKSNKETKALINLLRYNQDE